MSEYRPNAHACLTCQDPKTGQSTGKSAQGWSGHVSADGTTCFDCRGTGLDQSRYGTCNDCCPWCGADWKRPHSEDCPPRGPGLD